LRTPNPFPRIGTSVQVDWFGTLPQTQLNIFRSFEKQAESLYSMFSISLDEAISERNRGCKKQSIRLVGLSSDLCGRFAQCLDTLFCSMAEHCKECGTTPSFAPLCTEYFCGAPAKRAVLRYRFLYRLPGLRQRKFLRKIDILREIAASSNVEFQRAAISLVPGSSVIPAAFSWAKAVACNDDLNICLRESLVMLKCFLRILPADQVGLFQMRLFGHDGFPGPLIKLTTKVHFLAGR
jgi:hypothetical protein